MPGAPRSVGVYLLFGPGEQEVREVVGGVIGVEMGKEDVAQVLCSPKRIDEPSRVELIVDAGPAIHEVHALAHDDRLRDAPLVLFGGRASADAE